MAEVRQEFEFDILGCRVKFRPTDSGLDEAKTVVDLVLSEIQKMKKAKPNLKDTDAAVLVALKLAQEKMQLENDCKQLVLSVEEKLQSVVGSWTI